MDSSSDGSFAWTDASNDTIDSEPKVSNTMNKPNSEDESVSGKTYKKKLQEELFSQSNGNLLNEKLQQQNKKLKRKYTETHSENEQVESPKKRKIKREPESDIDVSSSKHKINNHNHSESHDSYDESYLKLKVKTEKQFLTPSPVKKKKSKSGDVSENVNEDSILTYTKKSKKQSKGTSEETEVEDDTLDQLVLEENEYHERKVKKKKKSKKRKDSTISNETQPQESHMDEDVFVEDGRTSPRHFTEELENNVTNVGQPDTPQKDKKAKSKKRSSKCSTGDPDNYSNEEADRKNQQPVTPINKSVTFQNHSESVQRTQSISERIQFEEDDSSDVDTSQPQISKPPTKSSKLKTFLNDNPSLKPFTSKLESDSVLTVDDEVWIIRCPKDVDIDAFQNKDFTVEGKCKVKLNGQTYEGAVDYESGNVSILSSEQSNFIIKSLTVRGCLNLRKRIPKAHFQDEAMIDNQFNFIPLPETKCRHPLFGSNYRKAIKLPASVADRLKLPEGGGDGGSAYKKKRKSQKERASPETVDHLVSTPKAESNPESSVKPEIESDHTVILKKKKKKRKPSDSGEIAPKKKRMKHNLESAEAWESEQAIEENLFTF